MITDQFAGIGHIDNLFTAILSHLVFFYYYILYIKDATRISAFAENDLSFLIYLLMHLPGKHFIIIGRQSFKKGFAFEIPLIDHKDAFVAHKQRNYRLILIRKPFDVR